MIRLQFAQAAAAYVMVFLVPFFIGWIFDVFQKRAGKSLLTGRLRQCSICTLVYDSVFDETITVCPRCGSYNERGGGMINDY